MTSYALWRTWTTTPSAEEPSEQKKVCGALLHPRPHLAPSAPLWAAGLIYFFNVTADPALPSPPPLIYGLHESLLILRGNTCIRCQRSGQWPFCSARPWKLGFFFYGWVFDLSDRSQGSVTRLWGRCSKSCQTIIYLPRLSGDSLIVRGGRSIYILSKNGNNKKNSKCTDLTLEQQELW